ncbi:hypothetical protein TMatcc_000755 [Talaromyces marneffei ATCC 18224]|nr:hypothetical protein EYB25_008252 [Talaromyces marneffei]
MRVPLEILRHILQDAVEILSITDLFRARLVNVLFADEILGLALEKFCIRTWDRDFEDPDKNAETCWNSLPMELKRSYIQRRIDQHPDQPCILSSNVHRMLELGADKISNKDQRAMLTEKLIDGILSGTFSPDIMFSIVHYKKRVQAKASLRPENAVCFSGVHHMLQLALAISAIKRSDCAELQSLFDQGLQPDLWTEELILRPLDVAASVGDQAIHKVLIANKCPMSNPRGFFEPWSNILTTAARCGNVEAVEEWTKVIQSTNYSYRDWMGHVIRLNKSRDIWLALIETHHSAARGGHVEILKLLDARIKDITAEKRFHSFVEAIKFGQCHTVDWFLDQGRIDLQMRTTHEKKGPMSAALFDTNWRRRPQMVRLLLERGANPNEVFSPTGRTLLQRALEKDDSETARLLVEHGADVSSSGYGPTCRKKPPLSIAIKRKNAPMVQLLLRKGANRMYGGLCEKKNHKERDITHIEKNLKSLGWDDKEVRDKALEYFALNFEGIRNPN